VKTRPNSKQTGGNGKKTQEIVKDTNKEEINQIKKARSHRKANIGKQKEDTESSSRKRRRKRIKETGRIKFEDKPGERSKSDQKVQKQTGRKKKVLLKKEVNEEEVQKQIKDTLARLTSKGKSKGSRHRRDKRAAASEKMQQDHEKQTQDKKILKATEFVSVNELANMMNVNVNEIISSCMSLGLFVSINQNLSAPTFRIHLKRKKMPRRT